MAEIRFPKIEIEKADMDRLENIVKRFEDAARIIELDNETSARDVIATQERQIRELKYRYQQLLEKFYRLGLQP